MRYRLANGLEVSASVPKLGALTSMLIGSRRGDDREAMRDFCKHCLPSDQFVEVVRKAPAAFGQLGSAILRDIGFEVAIQVHDEAELEGADAEAYIAELERGRKLYPADGDPRAVLRPMTVPIGNEERMLFMRSVQDREIEAFQKHDTFEAAKGLIERIIVWPKGGTSDFTEKAPGLYMTLALLALKFAGNEHVERLGE